MKKAVFLDRDNTLIKDPGYSHDPQGIEFIEGAIEALKLLHQNNFLLIIITNQSGIGRGIFSLKELEAVHKRLNELLTEKGIPLAGIYYCPHHPDDNCVCRKPKPYLIHQAAKEHDIDLAKSFLIGNDLRDMQTGKDAGVKTISVFLNEPPDNNLIDFNAGNLYEATKWILKNTL